MNWCNTSRRVAAPCYEKADAILGGTTRHFSLSVERHRSAVIATLGLAATKQVVKSFLRDVVDLGLAVDVRGHLHIKDPELHYNFGTFKRDGDFRVMHG